MPKQLKVHSPPAISLLPGMLHGQNFYVESTSSLSPMHKTVDPSQFCIDGSYYKKKFGVSSAIICTSPRIVPQFFSVFASDCSIISG